MSETTSTVMHSAGESDAVASRVVNDVIATTITTSENTPVLQMLEEEEQNANPLPPGTDSSAHQPAGGTMSGTTSTVMHSGGDSDVVASHVVNDVIATATTTTQPKNTPVLQMLEEEEQNANPLPPGTDSSAHQPAGGTMSKTTSIVMHSAGNSESDVAASHMVNDVIATTTSTQPKNTPALKCEICNIKCGTQGVLERHKLGKKHLKRLQKQPKNTPVLQCEIFNNITCGTQGVVERHKLGKKHLKTAQKLAEASAIDKPLADTNGLKNATSECGSSSSSGKKSATFQCEVCKISCNSNEILNMHLSGKKHLKKLKQSEEIPDPSDQPESTEGKSVELHQGKPLSCNLCGIACNSYDMLKKHNSGKKHQKNMEKSLKPIGPNPAPAMEPVATAPMMIGPLQDEGKIVKENGSNGKAKRARGHEDVETKKQKLSQGGASNALSTCTLCHVVCTSPELLISHFAGKKHLKLALKQAEAQFD
uniref:Zinc finger RNA-binding protein-like n=1 Tax=Tanacetum cinerariifolium TaxID=118510 RepID=A0A699H182_TANCI|nr:zinc finger RNA-binding protein-like [Tanacetum cinerariifolium]